MWNDQRGRRHVAAGCTPGRRPPAIAAGSLDGGAIRHAVMTTEGLPEYLDGGRTCSSAARRGTPAVPACGRADAG